MNNAYEEHIKVKNARRSLLNDQTKRSWGRRRKMNLAQRCSLVQIGKRCAGCIPAAAPTQLPPWNRATRLRDKGLVNRRLASRKAPRPVARDPRAWWRVQRLQSTWPRRRSRWQTSAACLLVKQPFSRLRLHRAYIHMYVVQTTPCNLWLQKGAFVVLKADLSKADCPIWRVDSHNLLQRFALVDAGSRLVYQGSTTVSRLKSRSPGFVPETCCLTSSTRAGVRKTRTSTRPCRCRACRRRAATAWCTWSARSPKSFRPSRSRLPIPREKAARSKHWWTISHSTGPSRHLAAATLARRAAAPPPTRCWSWTTRCGRRCVATCTSSSSSASAATTCRRCAAATVSGFFGHCFSSQAQRWHLDRRGPAAPAERRRHGQRRKAQAPAQGSQLVDQVWGG